MSTINNNQISRKSTNSVSKYDLWLYRLSYLSQGLFQSFIGMFFPIYLTFVAFFTAEQIAIFVLITQFPILLRPIFGIINDRMMTKKPAFPYIMLIISTGVYTISMIEFGLLLQNLQNTIFIVLSLIIYLAYSIFDTLVDFLVVSKQQQDNGIAVANLQFSAGIGNFITSQIYILIIGVKIANGSWNSFFYIFGIVGGIFFLITMLHPEKTVSITHVSGPNLESSKVNLSALEKKIVFITFLLAAGLQIPLITDYVFEPYIVSKFNAEGFNFYTNVGAYSQLLFLPIYFVCAKYRLKIYPYRIHILIGSGLYAVINWIAVAFAPLWVLLVFAMLSGLAAHLLMFSALSILIDATPKVAKATFYQLYSFIWYLSAYLFRAVGPLIYASIGVYIYIIAAILVLVYNLPVLLMLNKIMPYKEPEKSSL